MANECIPLYSPGTEIPCQASAAVTGKRFVHVSGAASPALTAGGNIPVAHATAAGAVTGVSAYDAASGAKLSVIRGSGIVVPVTAGGTIAVGAQVEVGTSGQGVTNSAGRAVGIALSAATSGNDFFCQLY